MTKHVVARTDEIPLGARKTVQLRGRDVAIFNVKGEYFAILDRCPHQGGSLSCGKLVGLVEAEAPGKVRYHRKGEIVRCPWHGWEFDLRTGKSYCDPGRTWVKSYPTNTESGSQLAEGPFVAETFEVRVEDTYIVIDA
jgi:3-phenylpropionate/trans-cinnamate dioxygenase ferredoxin subunit